MVVCLERGADCLHVVQLMPVHPKTPSSLASFKSGLVLPFWCRLTQVVLEKRPLNGCSVLVSLRSRTVVEDRMLDCINYLLLRNGSTYKSTDYRYINAPY